MIWLSTTAGSQQCSIYFEIRDIDIRHTGHHAEGVIRGLLGDGRRELWGEVFLGDVPRVQILPEWSEDGQVEGFDLELDENLLREELLSAVQAVFSQIGALASLGQFPSAHFDNNSSLKERSYLVA